ncbi:hypothetical protein [Guptibacillus algicola]|uniref:hypothetical protein n=1 Tax=Guptibacillus algicola TaxID=225844 RepID=UPI001CD23784|nr:hypothetical protein [Alkalihalobacillus algicola]MCA0988942.1 hypothetical protein [Alkalihalobacillus algicola]
MKERLYSPVSIGAGIGIVSTLIYIVLLQLSNFQHNVIYGILTMVLALIIYSIVAIGWMPSLLESRESVGLSAGITFHVLSSFSIVFLLAESIPGLLQLVLPYLSTLVFSLLMIGLLILSGYILTKVNVSKLQTTLSKKIPLKG